MGIENVNWQELYRKQVKKTAKLDAALHQISIETGSWIGLNPKLANIVGVTPDCVIVGVVRKVDRIAKEALKPDV